MRLTSHNMHILNLFLNFILKRKIQVERSLLDDSNLSDCIDSCMHISHLIYIAHKYMRLWFKSLPVLFGWDKCTLFHKYLKSPKNLCLGLKHHLSPFSKFYSPKKIIYLGLISSFFRNDLFSRKRPYLILEIDCDIILDFGPNSTTQNQLVSEECLNF